jgi:hypothetical protein
MKFTSEKFSNFIAVCNFIQNVCSDLQIKNNKIHQKSDNSVFVVKGDLSSIFENSDIDELKITPLVSKIQLLSTFIENDVPVTLIKKDDKYYSFSDNISKLEIRIPQEDILINKYDENLIIQYDENNLLFEFKLSTSMLKKIKKTTSITASNWTEINFDPEKEKVTAEIISSSKSIKLNLFEKEYNNIINRTEPFTVRISNEAFLNAPSSDEVDIAFYYDKNKDVVIQKSQLSIGEALVELYQRNRIKLTSEE